MQEPAAAIGGGVTIVASDVTRLDNLDRLYAAVKKERGRIDVLFADAGWGELGSIEAASEAQFDKTFDLNANGILFKVQKAPPIITDGGSIILTSSVANVRGDPAFSAFAAAKAAVPPSPAAGRPN